MERLQRWVILGAGLSPYTLDLWEAVASRDGQVVTLAYVPQKRQSDFAHEGDFIHSDIVELLPITAPSTAARLAIRCAKEADPIVVCMGYSPIYNLAISILLRLAPLKSRRLFYMSDTNGIAAYERFGKSLRAAVGSIGKRLILSRTFSTSLDLGFSNRLAHRALGIAKGVDLPLLPIDFPEDMQASVPLEMRPFYNALLSPRLLTVARLAPTKNLAALIAAFSSAIQHGIRGSLTIVGDGPDRANLAELAAETNGRVVLAGAIPFRQSRRIFGAFDAMVLPSIFEPWAIAITEALGWGIPVLSSKECGAGVSMAVEFGDAVKLSGTSRMELCASLMSFVQQLARHSQAATEAAPLVRKRFGLEEVADSLIALANESP